MEPLPNTSSIALSSPKRPVDSALHPATLIAKGALLEPEAPTPLTIERIYASPNLNGPIPKHATLSPCGKRILYLKEKDEESKHVDIWECDLKTKRRRLLVDSKEVQPGALVLSAISSYKWALNGEAIFFTTNGVLYLVHFTETEPKPVALPLSKGSNPLDVEISPDNRFISFVRDHNLYLYDLLKNKETKLTEDGCDTVTNGIADFIAREDLFREKGYWWSPNSKKIAFVRVDEGAVNVLQRCAFLTKDGITSKPERYPLPGSSIVSFKVGIFDIETSQTVFIDLGSEEDLYLARLDWLEDSSNVSLQLLDRNQQTLDLLFADPSTGETTLILREKTYPWINLHDDLRFFGSHFIWSSERSGYRHLYLYDLSGKLIRPLTTGEWAVKKVIGVNQERVFFEAFATSVLEKHLYSASIRPEEGGSLEQITTTSGWHETSVDKECHHFLDTFSSAAKMPKVSLHKIDGERIFFLEENALTAEHPYYPFASSHVIPEFGTIEASDGKLLHYRITKPSDFDPVKKYPAIITTYGGPGYRLVINAWPSDPSDLWEQVMASKGYLLFTIDNRGSIDRGIAFESPIYKRLGEVELEDQKTGATFLKTLPYVDSDRIGIFGWSYGGYMTLMAMFKGWEIFKSGVAVAPVTDWETYDTCYTEKYLGAPHENKEGYDKSNVLPYIHDKIGKLLLVHGMDDDNVFFSHSVKLIHAMQQKNVPFDLMTYPGEGHSIEATASRIHLYHKITHFFEEHLKP